MSTARQRSIATHPGENDRLVSRLLTSMPRGACQSAVISLSLRPGGIATAATDGYHPRPDER
jgi:hypothetical protein